MNSPVLQALTAVCTALILACGDTELTTPHPQLLVDTKGYICPAGFTYDPAYSPDPEDRSVDHNGDGVACRIDLGSVDHPNVVYVDNNVPIEWTGACPDGFSPVRFSEPQPGDANQDLVLCYGQRANGDVVIVDNRF